MKRTKKNTKIKICGITNLSDAMAASKMGAWALGFVFYRKSKRFIEPETAREISIAVKNHFKNSPLLIGVFVNEDAEEVSRIKYKVGLDYLQFHGDEDPDYLRQFSGEISAIRTEMSDDFLVQENSIDLMEYVLVDHYSKDSYGGNGKLSDWGVARNIKEKGKNLILSGGLSSENINDAIEVVGAYAYDLSSSVEKFPGGKCHLKLEKLFERLN
jgi:phosphoribosylanthranilate isomerase